MTYTKSLSPFFFFKNSRRAFGNIIWNLALFPLSLVVFSRQNTDYLVLFLNYGCLDRWHIFRCLWSNNWTYNMSKSSWIMTHVPFLQS
jgi:hypothetical protein